MLVVRNPLMASPKKIASPEKEIRFTRAAQGLLFLIAAVMMFSLSLGLWALATSGTQFERPRLEGYAWTALLPLPLMAWFFLLGKRCVRHAYLIFTPLGIEIFPLFRPEKHMTLITWQEIQDLDADLPSKRLSLHYNVEKTSGVIVSLSPILPAQRQLLQHTVTAIRQKRLASTAA
jgi:hypothetical protein